VGFVGLVSFGFYSRLVYDCLLAFVRCLMFICFNFNEGLLKKNKPLEKSSETSTFWEVGEHSVWFIFKYPDYWFFNLIGKVYF
jgi:hypothetical protein